MFPICRLGAKGMEIIWIVREWDIVLLFTNYKTEYSNAKPKQKMTTLS